MRALILGGGGAIGSAIARHADAAGIDTHVGVRPGSTPLRLAAHPRVRVHHVDVTDATALQRVLAGTRPDWLVMSALPGGHHAPTPAEREQLLLGMCRGLLGVLEAARAAGFRGRLTWIGSAMSYGACGDRRDANAAMRPRTFRGAVKAAESLLAAQLAAQFGIALSEARVFTGYGPYEQRERLVPSLLRAALAGGRVPLTPVPASRDWIHYDDIARACLASATSAAAPPLFNACSGRLHDTHAVAALLESITGRTLVADTPYPVADTYGAIEPGIPPGADDGLGWTPRIGLEEGLEDAWHWARTPAGRAYLLREATA